MTGTRLGAASLALASLLAGSGCSEDGKKSAEGSPDATLEGDAGSDGGDDGDGSARADAGQAEFALTLGEAKKAMIDAEGGTIVLSKERFSLEVPKGALEQPTEITATPLKRGEDVFAIALQPSGLTFEKPAVGRISVERESAEQRWIAPVLYDDDGEAEPVKKLALDLDSGDEPSDRLEVRFEVPHFSVLTLVHRGPRAGAEDDVLQFESLAPDLPWSLPVGVVFNTPYRANLVGDTLSTQFCETSASGLCIPFIVDAQVTSAASIFKVGTSGAVASLDHFNVISRREFGRNTPAMLFPGFACDRTGSGTASVTPVTFLTVQASLPNLRILEEANGTITATVVEGRLAPVELQIVRTHSAFDYQPITCTKGGSVLGAMALTDEDVLTMLSLAKPGWFGGCVVHSNGETCKVPELPTWLLSVTDPVLQLGPNAAARLDAAFACGEGSVGTTLCASGAPVVEGDWVYVAATVAEDLVLDDPTSSYQLAFVFDADGNPANNYVPAPQYPNDFFQGTDKWYQALYEPGAGWELQVSDTRLGGSQVASDARFVLAGRQLALLVPRSELDGDSPTFRVTAFRHEGDYGLSGGPWSASYAPGLMEPLFEAASGTPIVVPE